MESKRDGSKFKLTAARPVTSSSLEEYRSFHGPSQEDDMAVLREIAECVWERAEDEDGA